MSRLVIRGELEADPTGVDIHFLNHPYPLTVNEYFNHYSEKRILKLIGIEVPVDWLSNTTSEFEAVEPTTPRASSTVKAAHKPVPRWLKASWTVGLVASTPAVGVIVATLDAAGASATMTLGV
jgi:hypothetical protein